MGLGLMFPGMEGLGVGTRQDQDFYLGHRSKAPHRCHRSMRRILSTALQANWCRCTHGSGHSSYGYKLASSTWCFQLATPEDSTESSRLY